MRDLILKIVIGFFFTNALFSQVGIGTTNPTAELEIETTNTGIPALELNPQSAPTGTTVGQIAVIGDKLFMYDATRTKWLSVETTALQFGRNGSTDNRSLRFGGNVENNNTGAMMPFNGTIVAVTSRATAGLATKQFQIRVRNGTTNVATSNFNLVANEYTSTTDNLDFSAGDYITVFAQATGAAVTSPTVVLWVKWRE